MQRLLLLLFALFTTWHLNAQVVEHVYTRDGAVYEGYISEQIPGKCISICAERAKLVLPISNFVGLKYKSIEYNNLPDEAKEWFNNLGKKSNIKEISFEDQGAAYGEVYLINETNDSITIVSFDDQTYTIDWDSVIKTIKIHNDAAPYGVCESVITSQNRSFRGNIKEQYIGEYIIFMMENGDLMRLATSSILNINAYPISESHSLWEQLLLLDRLILTNGTVYEGFITKRVMGSKVFIQEVGSNSSIAVDLRDIEKYQKVHNNSYKQYIATPVVATNEVLPEKESEVQVENLPKESNLKTEYVLVNNKEVEIIKGFEDTKRRYFPGNIGVTVNQNERIVIELQGITPKAELAVYLTKDVMPDVDMNTPNSLRPLPSVKWSDSAVLQTPYFQRGNRRCAEFTLKNVGTYFIAIEPDMSLGVLIVVKSDKI